MDAHSAPYEQVIAFGGKLVEEQHYEVADIKEKLAKLETEWNMTNA